MTARADCPGREQWASHLRGTLDPQTQDELAAHLDGCADCQQALEGLVAGDSLVVVAGQVGREPESTEPALQQVLEHLQHLPEATQGETLTADDRSQAISFLAPSVNPGELGRLGHYQVLELIGKGGFGEVFRAFDGKLHRVVALKVLSPELAVSGTARKRFVREAQAAASVKDDHVIAIYAVEDEANPPYLAMEYVAGQSLQDRLDREGPLELKEILRIGLQAARGLEAAHKQGLIHRDIKPANILLENGVQRVKITDFGLARAVDDASLTQSGVIAGTPMYMAPEQAEGLNIDHRADLFSLGSVLYVMCTRRLPFRAGTTVAVLRRVIDDAPRPIPEINPDIPDWLCSIVNKLQAKRPEERYQSAHEVAEVLGQRLAGLQLRGAGGLSAQPSEPESPPPRGKTPRRYLLAAAMLALAACVGLAIFWPRERTAPLPPDNPLAKTNTDTDGWVTLFDGTGLSRWEHLKEHNWTVKDGVLTGSKGTLYSKDRFRDFQLRATVRYAPNSYGSLAFRVSPAAHGEVLLGDRITPGSIDAFTEGKSTRIRTPPPKLTRPGEWFDLELTVRGGQVTLSIGGKVCAEADIGYVPREGRVTLNAYQNTTLVEFRRIAIRELLPTPPTDRLPFVILARGDRGEQGHATLKGAVEGARSGDVIELRDNGPFDVPALDLGTRALTIRAGKACRPVLRLFESDGLAGAPLIATNAPLVLGGLELWRAGHVGTSTYTYRKIVLARAALFACNCRFVNTSPSSPEVRHARTIEMFGGDLRLCNCEFLNNHKEDRGIALQSQPEYSSEIRNCIFTSRGVEICFFNPGGRMLLEGCTFLNHLPVMLVVFQMPGEDALNGKTRPVNVSVRSSIFRRKIHFAYVKGAFPPPAQDKILSDDDLAALLPRFLGWSETNTLHHSPLDTSFLILGTPAATRAKPVGLRPHRTLSDWKEFWRLPELNSREGEVRFQGEDIWGRLLRDPHLITPADFRIVKGGAGEGMLPGENNVGADVDLVGPGEAYERWKQSPAYQEWGKKIDELMKSEAARAR